jgi:hypothetical protein
MPLYLEPIRIIESTSGDRTSTRNPFNSKGHVGAAARTKLKPQPSAALVRAMLITGERTTGYLYILSAENCHQGIGTASTTLAKGAVTDVRSQRVALDAIPNVATETASLMKIRHTVAPFLHFFY